MTQFPSRQPGDPTSERRGASDIAPRLVVATLVRLVVNTAKRFPYPFASALGRGLDLPLTAVTSMIAVNQATGLLSPAFGPLVDLWGSQTVMAASLALFSTGLLVAGAVPAQTTVLLGLVLAGIAKSIYDPALQAYIGKTVPFQRRGLAVGLAEFAWAGSALVGLPMVGLLIDRAGWRSPFLVLGGLGLVGLTALQFTRSGEPRRDRPGDRRPQLSTAVRWVITNRAALGGLAFSLLIAAANDNLFVVYGSWLQSSFGLSIFALGATTTVIGVAEWIGELLTASLADRLGLKRAVVTGLLLSTACYALVPCISHSLPLAMAGLFGLFLSFEFTFVTSFSLFTEVVPRARGTMMASAFAAASVGRMLGALAGGRVWTAGGLSAVSSASAVASALALAFLLWGLRGWRPPSESEATPGVPPASP